MPDYTFYLTVYRGDVLPDETAFAKALLRAQAHLNRWKACFSVQPLPNATDAEKMALCAMADAVYEFAQEDERRGFAAVTVGSVKETYADSPALSDATVRAREGYLRQQAGCYLMLGRWMGESL